jgi:hypothetical protein
VEYFAFAIGGAVAICLGLAPLIYGIVTLRDEILHRELRAEKEEDDSNT